jgi:hypothetical protein
MVDRAFDLREPFMRSHHRLDLVACLIERRLRPCEHPTPFRSRHSRQPARVTVPRLPGPEAYGAADFVPNGGPR